MQQGGRPPVAGLDELGLPPELVIGEAVVLDLRPASFATRAMAVLLDLVVQGAVLAASVIVAGASTADLDPAAGAALGVVITVTALVGVPVVLETITRGRSLGKFVFGLRVVREDGGPIRFRQALVRALVAVFEFYLTSGAVALISSLLDARAASG